MNFFMLILLMPLFSFASIDVAFIELRNHNGQLLQLEPNGKFTHIAISYRGGWLHSHPNRGVEVISQDNLEKIGTIKAITTVTERDSLNESQVRKYLDKPYDPEFSWRDDKIYCSELVAKLLNIDPLPMTFETEVWPDRFKSLKGQLSLSPDDIFQLLIKKVYQGRSFGLGCSKVFG